MLSPEHIKKTSKPTGMISYSWFLSFRYMSNIGQILTIFFASIVLSIKLPLLELFSLIVFSLTSNILLHFSLHRNTHTFNEQNLLYIQIFDLFIFTALLYFSGGHTNPFSFLFIVNIGFSAFTLAQKWSWFLVTLSISCLAFLFKFYQPIEALEMHHMPKHTAMNLHLQGMWVASAIAGVFIVYFMQRLKQQLTDQQKLLIETQEKHFNLERLASLSTVVAGAAHELSTPLSTISLIGGELKYGLSKLKSKLLTPEKTQLFIDDLALIQSQTKECQIIIRRMSVEYGSELGGQFENIKILNLLELAVFTSKLKQNPEIDIKYNIASELDRLELFWPQQNITNILNLLINNSIDALSHIKSPIIQINAQKKERMIQLEIIDNGHGIQTKDLKNIKEPFFTTKEAGLGMGLGLFICEQNVRKIGGSLQLQSQSNQGTNACLLIPQTIHII